MILEYLRHIEFGLPWMLLLLCIPGWQVYRALRKPVESAAMQVSSLQRYRVTATWKYKLRHLPFILRILALIFIIIAMAKPQRMYELKRTKGEGIDIVICLDVSGSMLAQDFTPNRLESAKEVAGRFIQSRPADRIGLVVFSGESFTQCPLTTDHDMLLSQLFALRSGLLADGTAIGSGLAMGVERLLAGGFASRVLILLTDGENNGGLIDPQTARDYAVSKGVKVYTIGMGTEGFALTPVQQEGGQIMMQRGKVNIDERLLKDIAEATGGRYFRAKDDQALSRIYGEINTLEKRPVEVTKFNRHTEKFHFFVWCSLVFLLSEVFLRLVVLRKFP